MTQEIFPAAPSDQKHCPQPVASATPDWIPRKEWRIQYNVCKNPCCSQFGVPHGEMASDGSDASYSKQSGGKSYPLLKCDACGETPPMKSNKGIEEEIARLSAYLRPRNYFCPDEGCRNHYVPVGTPGAYRSKGRNSQGTPRWTCMECKRSFAAGGKPAKGQWETHKNRDVFAMLVNGVPFARIVRMTGISWETLYNRIDFIHRQCMAFAGHRERKLKELPIDRLYLAVDNQDHVVNWTERLDKRNVVLKSMTISDNKSGYVFCDALNFDDAADRDAVEAEALANRDHDLPAPLRRHARFWTSEDYKATAKKAAKKLPAGSLEGDIRNTYNEAMSREDIEVFDEKTDEEALPMRGMQVHSEYTMIAAFHHVRAMCGKVEKWRIFMDQDSGIRSACLSAFAPDVKARKADAFFVKIEKNLTNDDKEKAVKAAKKRVRQKMGIHPGMDEERAKLELLKEEIANRRVIGGFGDRWVSMPLPTKSEPELSVCWITPHDGFVKDDGTPDEDHVAWLLNKASLHSADTFFMKTRRSISMCERSISSSANSGKVWTQHQAYDPSILKKLLEIYRIHHNFTDLPMEGKKAEKKTPAMRLGLADAPLDLQDILYFQG
jgi:transposase-like protein